MALELKKIDQVSLRSLGFDERWLQDRIAEDPSLLGLGDLDVIRRERNQTSGGRIDFLIMTRKRTCDSKSKLCSAYYLKRT